MGIYEFTIIFNHIYGIKPFDKNLFVIWMYLVSRNIKEVKITNRKNIRYIQRLIFLQTLEKMLAHSNIHLL